MKKTVRRLLSLALCLCLIMAMAVPALAVNENYNFSSTYNTQGYGIADKAYTDYLYIQTGSNSTLELFGYADYWVKDGTAIYKAGTFSSPRTTTSSAAACELRPTASFDAFCRIMAVHYVDGVKIHTTPYIYAVRAYPG